MGRKSLEYALPSMSPTTDSVIEVLKRRRAGERDDGYRVAVALEGGGLRGVVSGAMLIALHDLGFADHVDVYYGTSSGSINVTYFAAGGSWNALSVYYDHLTNGFVPRLPLVSRLDMDLLDRVMRFQVPLDVTALRRSTRDTRIVLTNVKDVRPEIVPIRNVDDPVSYLIAGSWLPLLAGRPVELKGRDYLDGGLLYADPTLAALDESCSHILAVNTTGEVAETHHSRRLRVAMKVLLNDWHRGLGDGYFNARREWDVLREHLSSNRSVRVNGSIVTRIRPAPGSHQVKRLTMDRALLLDGARVGYATIFSAFGEPQDDLYFSVTA